MAATGTSSDAGTVLGDRYALVGVLGAGASARVFLATDLRRQCPVAVKVLHESPASDERFVAQLRREASLAASLSHDNVLRIIDSGSAGEPPVHYVVTDYMAGGSLAGMLDAGETLDPAQVADVGRQVADALAYAHDANLVHRDVKPSNILFDAGGRVVLGDFGIARAVAEASSTEPADAAMGATRYASPESVMGRATEPRSDVYSLCLVLVEALTGSVPLLGDTPVATMGRRLAEEVRVPRGLGRLGAALEAAAATDPSERIDAHGFAEMLTEAGDDLEPPEPLPLHPVDAGGEQTAELRIDRSGGAVRILGIAPMGVGGSPRPVGDDDEIDLRRPVAADGEHGTPGRESLEGVAGSSGPDTGGDAGTDDRPDGVGDDPADRYGRDAITVADEFHALGSRLPATHGVVEPLEPPGATKAAVPAKAAAESNSRRGQRRRWPWVLAALLVLAVAGSAVWWFFVRVPVHEVPDWVGSDLPSVTAAAEANGWDVGTVERTRRDGTSAGQVLAQDPGAGTELAEGSTIDLTVSDGPTLTALPEVTGLPEEEALAALGSAGLVAGERSEAFDEVVPPGALVSATPSVAADEPDARGRVPKGTAVDYVVSVGPAPRVVPERIVGVPVATAEAALAEVQLGSSVSSEYSSEVSEGLVIRASAASGTELPRDTVVELVVSAGPQPIVVPDVTGSTGTAAAATLEEAGFTVSGIEGSPSGTVLATDPPAGESRVPGSPVRIFTRSG